MTLNLITNAVNSTRDRYLRGTKTLNSTFRAKVDNLLLYLPRT